MVEILTHQVKHQIRIQLVLILLITTHLKHKTTTAFVLRVLPLRLNTLLEKLHGINTTPTILHQITTSTTSYLF